MAFEDFFSSFKKISKISDRGMSGTASADCSTSSSEDEICYKHTFLQPAAQTGSGQLEATNAAETLSRQEERRGA